jgi:hypothetical protein
MTRSEAYWRSKNFRMRNENWWKHWKCFIA